jgi:hypothetical protein
MTRRAAYTRTLAFLDACTKPAGPTRHAFRVNRATPELPEVGDLERELRRRFGGAPRSPDRMLDVAGDRVDDALDFLDDIDP